MRPVVLGWVIFSGLGFAAPAQAAICADEVDLEAKLTCIFRTQVTPLIEDLDVILVEGPRYLAQRLPALQSMGDLGGPMDLEAPGDFSFALGVMSGVYREFNDDVASHFQRLPRTLPEPLPVPAITLAGRYALSADWELTGRFAFFPQFTVSTQDWDISATTRIMAAGARYRLLAGHGAVPTLVSSAEVSYFTGYMEVGRGFTYPLITLREAARTADVAWEPVRDAINEEYRARNGGEDLLSPQDDVTIGTFFHGAPILGWDIFQVSVEQRAVWDAGFWHPYLGLGLDAATGHVDSGIQLEIDLRVTRPQHFIDVAGNLKEPILDDQDVTIESRDPRAVGARGIVGWEFELGRYFRLPMEAQYDFGSGSFLGGLAVRFAWR